MSAATDTLEMMALFKRMAPAMEAALKERSVQEAVDGGAAVAVRPWSFRHPLKGEVDPWFGMAYQDWLALRNEGFEGIFTPNSPGSERAKIFIIYDEAAAFLKARAGAQASALADRGEATARLRVARQKGGV